VIEDLKDKVVLITGASTGIGAAAAEAFGANGARVAVHYNKSRAEAEEVEERIERSGGQALLVAGDVTQREAIASIVAKTVATFGRIDVLINNAGSMVERAPIEAITDELFDQVMRINAWSVTAACREVVPHFRAQGGGNIINVTSIAARNGGGPGAVLYAGSKGFVSTVTRGLARELVKDRIRVNAIAPGIIMTPFHDRYTTPEQLAALTATIPMGRAGAADECAGTLLYLASDALSGYVTGQILEVNGGALMP
jgi:3-oxoacyl-[acyl-carrier protein] reductase